MRKIKPTTEEAMIVTNGSAKKGKATEQYPTIRIDLDHIPEAKKWKVGSEYEIELKVKMVGLSQSRFDNSAEFELREIETYEEGSEKEE